MHDESNLAFRSEKLILAKMAHRISGRRTGWQNSLFKFDGTRVLAKLPSVSAILNMCADWATRNPRT